LYMIEIESTLIVYNSYNWGSVGDNQWNNCNRFWAIILLFSILKSERESFRLSNISNFCCNGYYLFSEVFHRRKVKTLGTCQLVIIKFHEHFFVEKLVTL
jgi:hypothetical protein